MTGTRKTTKTDSAKNVFSWFLIILILPFLAFEKKDAEFRCFPLKDENCAITQGEVLGLLVSFKQAPKSVRGRIWQKPVVFNPSGDDRMFWMAFLPANRSQAPGQYLLHVFARDNSGRETEFLLPIIIEEKEYPIEELSLPPEMVYLSPEALELVKKDNRILIAAMGNTSPAVYWHGMFIAPIPGGVTSNFGTRRIINRIPKSPHSGTDLAAAEGENVQAVNSGKVSLVYEGYLTGRSVIIDHGGGIYSVYYHLSEAKVKDGDMVQKGDVIGLSGSTGRVSGPHLHFGVRINRSYVNPMVFLDVSRQMEQAFSDLAGD